MTLDNITEKRYVLIITTLVGIIGFLLGAGSTNIINNIRLEQHKEIEGHPLTVHRLQSVEESNKDIKIQLKEMNNKLNTVLVRLPKQHQASN